MAHTWCQLRRFFMLSALNGLKLFNESPAKFILDKYIDFSNVGLLFSCASDVARCGTLDF